MFKEWDETIINALHTILNDIWREETALGGSNTGLIMKLSKKGHLSTCNNWRGITLTPLTLKIFNRIVLLRMKKAVEGTLREEQASF